MHITVQCIIYYRCNTFISHKENYTVVNKCTTSIYYIKDVTS